MIKRILLAAILFLAIPCPAQELKVLNSFNPGELFEVETYLRRNQANIIVFWSRHSEPSRRLQDALEQLSRRRRDELAIGLIDVDRKDANDIDWRSPLVRQFNLRTLPYVQFVNEQGEVVSEGYAARKQLLRMLDLAGISVGR